MPSVIHRIRRTTGTGDQRLESSITAQTDYAYSVCRKYCRHIAQTGEDVSGKIIVELGPGDTLATALFFLARGAARAICIDRFKLVWDAHKNTAIARCVLSMLPDDQQLRLQNMLTFDERGHVRWTSTRLDYIHSRTDRLELEDESVDIIVSNAVLEHVRDLETLFADMSRILKPGGIMVHAADLKSHGLHRTTSLDFLALPERLWTIMTSHRGSPNRCRKSDYQRLLDRFGFEVSTFTVTDHIPRQDIDIFVRLYPDCAARFSTEDLSCGSILFTAQKRPRTTKERGLAGQCRH